MAKYPIKKYAEIFKHSPIHAPYSEVLYDVKIVILSIMVSEKMGLPFRRGRGRRTVYNDNTNFWKNGFFNNLLWKNYPVNFHEIFRVCLSCRGLLLCKFS